MFLSPQYEIFARFHSSIFEQSHQANLEQHPALRLIAGDASDRKFYRVVDRDLSAICMEFPKWEGGYGGDPLSWLGMREALHSIGIPVPKVLMIDEHRKCIWTEDFGDQFLNCYLDHHHSLDINNPAAAMTLELYKGALDLLIQAQYPDTPIPDHPAQKLAFDQEKLMFEMNFFNTHFLNGILDFSNLKLPEIPTWEILSQEFDHLCHELSNRPRVLCHRDYHVRNVMVVDQKPKWIDFQDARMGPCTYDLVSLVRDSYVIITPPTREHLIHYFYTNLTKAMEKHGAPQIPVPEFFREYALMGLQRNIKAIGSFGYLATVKNKSGYLKYVPHTLEVLTHDSEVAGASWNLKQEFPSIFKLLQELKNGSLAELLRDQIRSRTGAE